jgi:small-conductance mechanosensitive channel
MLLEEIRTMVILLLPSLSVILTFGLLLFSCYWFLIKRHPELGSERKLPQQVFMLILTLIGVLALVISLPIDENSRNEIIGLIGILLSGMIAFSSTNVIANLMAGLLLRITRPFRTGDFISVGDHFGRVTERGIFDTEIQSEHRELIAFPNTYLIKNPVSTIRSSGAIVSVTLSLGYDLHYLKIEPLLLEAAEKSGLSEPFVTILELGDFSITYRISGLLVEVKGVITARSNLFRAVLDTLHGNGVEIVSPSFMNQRRLADDYKTIPTPIVSQFAKETVSAEEIVFDKAEQAEQAEGIKRGLTEEIEWLESLLKDVTDDKKKRLKEQIMIKREHLTTLTGSSSDKS